MTDQSQLVDEIPTASAVPIRDSWQSPDTIRRLLDSSPDACLVSRIDNFKFVAVNSKACENYGYTRKEFLQMGIFDIELVALSREEIQKLYCRCLLEKLLK